MSLRLVISILAVFLSSDGVFGQNGTDPQQEFADTLECAATSGDQVLCNKFLMCNDMLPDRIYDAYEECFAQVCSDDCSDLKCDANTELYGSQANRQQIAQCIKQNVQPPFNSMEIKELDCTQTCIKTLAEECPSGQRS
ncbi:hypothetical protein CDAR_555841 [Caerostris darwini]|uniref:Uncharacterized protein n=1 Tax=Caerostris darwini TaxID=1538125 RepID=A0AAV4NRM4_9ARAC|nr:hypothetical protein CDAR_555841 [Caerostris darwini]